MQVRRLDSWRSFELRRFWVRNLSRTLNEIEWWVPNANRWGLSQTRLYKCVHVVGKALLLCGHMGLDCCGVPRPAMFRSNRKSQPERGIDSRKLTGSRPNLKWPEHHLYRHSFIMVIMELQKLDEITVMISSRSPKGEVFLGKATNITQDL